MNNNKFKSLLISCVVVTLVSCQNSELANTTKIENQKSSNFVLSSDWIKDPDKSISCDKESGFGTKAETESKDSTQLVGTVEGVIPSKIDENDIAGFYVGKTNNNPHSVANPVPDAKEGQLTLIFEDSYKIRVKSNETFDIKAKTESEETDYIIDEYQLKENKKEVKKSFESKSGSSKDSIRQLNKLMKEYNVKSIFSYDNSEEDSEKMEKSIESTEKYDIPNNLSIYTLDLKDSNLREFCEKLRKIDIVREVNFVYPSKPDYSEISDVPSNEPIFGNSLDLGIPLVSNDSNRYNYARVNGDLFWGLIKQHNTANPSNQINPAKSAVIDTGFARNHEDVANYVDKFHCIANGCIETSAHPFGDNSLDDVDENGYVEAYDIDYKRDLQHGGAVASVLGSPINGKGIVGFASNPSTVKIVPMFNRDVPAIARAITQVIDYNTSHQSDPIRVINISQSNNVCLDYFAPNSVCPQNRRTDEPIEFNSDVRTQIDNARQVGILTVITAGNEADRIGRAFGTYSKSSALVVGGTAKMSNGRAVVGDKGGSSWGKRVDISAPYENIPVISMNSADTTKYQTQPGTSVSAPIVSALASILFNSRADLKIRNASRKE